MPVEINLSTARSRSMTGGTLQVTHAQPDAADIITPSSTPQTTEIAATSTDQIWEIYTDVKIVVSAGKAPNAATMYSRTIPAGATRWYGVESVGELLSVKTP